MSEPSQRAPALGEIRERLTGHRSRREPPPDDDPRTQAAVSLILSAPHEGEVPELLFIERARHEGDPWSGQMAFPGGRREPSDHGLWMTAARETHEEVGIQLPGPVGTLDDMSNASMRERVPDVALITVTPFVYTLTERPTVDHNHEVASTVWVPLDWILHEQSAASYELSTPGFGGRFPAFVYEGYKVWGMTYRICEILAGLFDARLPASQEYPQSLRRR